MSKFWETMSKTEKFLHDAREFGFSEAIWFSMVRR